MGGLIEELALGCLMAFSNAVACEALVGVAVWGSFDWMFFIEVGAVFAIVTTLYNLDVDGDSENKKELEKFLFDLKN